MTVFHVMTAIPILVIELLDTSQASTGDRSSVFEHCTNRCVTENCSSHIIDDFYHQQPLLLRFLRWDCLDECKYQCMWQAVYWFTQKGMRVPQFYGKWPFLRVFGLQEPASTVFSVLNALVHFLQWRKFSKVVPSQAPMYYIHLGYALVSINAWIWSTIFHSRDVNFTEMMDYFCALMGVMYSSFLLFIRWSGTTPTWKPLAIGIACIAFYVRHISYLAFVKFDYDYNMKIAISVGLFNVFGWIVWSAMNYSRQPYVWKCAATVILLNILLGLEVGDFPPLWFIFDAHSLWHFGTIPIPVLWYSFVIDDCQFLMKQQKLKHEGSWERATVFLLEF